MFFHYLDASSVGGIETHVETLALSQSAAGLPATVVLHRDYPDANVGNRYKEQGLNVHVAGNACRLAQLLFRHRPAILHTHGYKAGIIGRPLARLAAVPVISTFHAGERGQGRMALYQSIDAWTSFAGGRLAVSEEIANSLPFQTHVMRNFVPLSRRARPVPDKRRFVFAGRLSHEKGPDIFCKLAERNQSHAKFEMYGDGPMLSELRHRYEPFVTFHGFTNKIANALGDASALIMTSRHEGLPMIALEAMAMGVPVIAPAVGGLQDLISHGKNGYLFQAEDMTSLEKILAEFFDKDREEIATIGTQARRTISDAYSPEAVLPRLLAAYRRAGLKSSRSIKTNVQSSIG